jgi:Methyltransferase domain
MKEILAEIERHLPEGGAWCSLVRAQALASLVLALRPRRIVEIGCWMGGSAIPMLLALRYLHTTIDDETKLPLVPDAEGRLLTIDPWSPDASIRGLDDVNRKWWGNVDHDHAYRVFCERLGRHGVGGWCDIERKRSDDVAPFSVIDLLNVDGNHSEQAIRDVERFAPSVPVGGILALDDVGWSGGHVATAKQTALAMGFAERYRIGTGVIMQRVREAA